MFSLFFILVGTVCSTVLWIRNAQLAERVTWIEKTLRQHGLTIFSLIVMGLVGQAQDGASGGSPTIQGQDVQQMELSPEVRGWYRNPDGSCVQCSIGMAGCWCNDPVSARLLWDSEFGSAIRGGSWPGRVEAYCDERKIRAWSVTGASIDDTIPWLEWAARTGRFAAVGAGTAHFQTLYGFNPSSREWYVCNNNSPQKIDRYSDKEFRQLHSASGPWCVILQKPSSPPPRFEKWWTD